MNVFSEIDQALAIISHGWTSSNKAHALASAVLTLRPDISVEVGVWAGKGMISLAIAHKYITKGMVYGVDPYSAEASVEGQVNDQDKKWWGDADHQKFYDLAKSHIIGFEVQNSCQIVRKKSDDFDVPDNIGVLVLDGNHGEQSIRDVRRYAPKVKLGGVLFADDLHWSGSAVEKAVSLLPEIGFQELYRVEKNGESWGAFQRIYESNH